VPDKRLLAEMYHPAESKPPKASAAPFRVCLNKFNT
jgi:hypothetical protein